MQNTENQSLAKFGRLPGGFVWAIMAISVLPVLLTLLGVDFSSQGRPFPWDKAADLGNE